MESLRTSPRPRSDADPSPVEAQESIPNVGNHELTDRSASSDAGAVCVPAGSGPGSSPEKAPLAWLFYDRKLDLAGCSQCKQVLSSPEHVRTHIKQPSTPHDHKSTISNKKFQQLVEKKDPSQEDSVALYRNAPESLKFHTSSTLTAVSWLPIYEGFSCCVCSAYFHRLRSNMEEHFKTEHPDVWKTHTQSLITMCPANVPMQTLFLGNKT